MDAALAAIAAAQYGAFTASQALGLGFTRSAIRERIASGRWIVLDRGVYAIAGTSHSREQRVMAAILAMGSGAAASNDTACDVWKLIETHGAVVHVILPADRRSRGRNGIVVHRATLRRSDIRTVNHIRVTAPNRTLVDAAATLSPRHLEDALDTAMLRGLTSLKALRRYIDERNLAHRPGVGSLTRLIEDRALGVPESKLERIFLRKLRASRLPAPIRQFKVGRRRIDMSYPDHQIIVELDGKGSRFKRSAFQADKRRQNEVVLGLPGWTLLRFTWNDVVDDWPYVEATLRQALGA